MLKLGSVILECGDVWQECAFYSALTGWPLVFEEEGFLRLQEPDTGVGIAFQQNEDYIRPVWPDRPGAQQMMAHLDFAVKDARQLSETMERALELGAQRAQEQYGGEDWVTLLDPAGHPFCLVVWG